MWFLSVMLIIFLIFIFLFTRLVRKERQIYGQIIAKIYEHLNVSVSDKRPIIFLSYKSDIFQEADRLLETTDAEKLIVVFSAPDWLVSQKQRKWSDHVVVHAKELGWEIEKVSILQIKPGGIIKIKHVTEYLRNIQQNERGIHHGVLYSTDTGNSSYTRTLS